MRNRLLPHSLGALAAGLLAACGGGGSSPEAPGGPATPSVPTYSVTATVFLDENGNGQLDAGENTRVPGVEVVIGTGAGRSASGTGQAQVTGIREGTHNVELRVESIPTYFQPQAPFPVQVPGGPTEVRVPLQLPIGRNGYNLYLGYGDSITNGEGSSDGNGYTLRLLSQLGPHFGRAEVVEWGRSGTNSAEGATRTRVTLGWYHPAYLLIMYGTNDWNAKSCQTSPPAACFTIESLRQIVEDAKAADTLPVLASIIPANPARETPNRNLWYDQMNVLIKALAAEQGVLFADLNAEFKATGNLPSLFVDEVHPNDAGYQVMAQGWFKAITRARSASASASPRFGFRLE
jgi:lysophospholipase L1-like esterase